MSLFKTKEWQLIKVGQNEEFDRHLIETIYSNVSNDNIVIIGSFDGYVRGYQISKGNTKNEPMFEFNLQ